jgi:hypothetical protein
MTANSPFVLLLKSQHLTEFSEIGDPRIVDRPEQPALGYQPVFDYEDSKIRL